MPPARAGARRPERGRSASRCRMKPRSASSQRICKPRASRSSRSSRRKASTPGSSWRSAARRRTEGRSFADACRRCRSCGETIAGVAQQQSTGGASRRDFGGRTCESSRPHQALLAQSAEQSGYTPDRSSVRSRGSALRRANSSWLRNKRSPRSQNGFGGFSCLPRRDWARARFWLSGRVARGAPPKARPRPA